MYYIVRINSHIVKVLKNIIPMLTRLINTRKVFTIRELVKKPELSDNIGFSMFKLKSKTLYDYNDGNFRTLVSGFTKNSIVNLPVGYTHFGIVMKGEIYLKYSLRKRILTKDDFFSVVGPAVINSKGLGMIISAKNYTGMNLSGGPLEEKGRLKYIDGCTDTLLIAPVRKGDPCLNHLHFPSGIVQTPHTHPSVRIGVVYKGSGECILPTENIKIPLMQGHAFVIKTNTVHSFNTKDESMDIVAFHPDSDTGMTDDDHPMINRTIVDGVSANFINAIKTR